ncbi:MAG: TolC family protein [Catalinimonas sp.]
MKRPLFLFVTLLITAPLRAEPDTTAAFTLVDLYGLIAETHPVVRQANLYRDAADAELRQARGFFDPKLEAAFDRKEFKDKSYYNLWDSYLKVPVWVGGVDLYAGVERGVGDPGLNAGDDFVSDQRETPVAGLAYAGVSVPLGQGMFIDARRAAVRQAQVYQRMADADRLKMINKILWSATKDYYDWFQATQQYRYLTESLAFTDTLYEATKTRVEFGEQAPIDSVEAKINLQDRRLRAQQALLDIQNARNTLSNHLWNERGEPVVLDAALRPEDFALVGVPPTLLDSLLAFAETRHPSLVNLEGEIEQLQIEQRLARERLKPTLDVKFNLLSAATSREEVQNNLNYAFLQNNYKVGVDFSFPLFLRKERGKLQLVGVKAQQTTFAR